MQHAVQYNAVVAPQHMCIQSRRLGYARRAIYSLNLRADLGTERFQQYPKFLPGGTEDGRR